MNVCDYVVLYMLILMSLCHSSLGRSRSSNPNTNIILCQDYMNVCDYLALYILILMSLCHSSLGRSRSSNPNTNIILCNSESWWTRHELVGLLCSITDIRIWGVKLENKCLVLSKEVLVGLHPIPKLVSTLVKCKKIMKLPKFFI